MAWVIAGLGLAAGATYVTTAVSDAVTELVKPYYDWKKGREIDEINYNKEERVKESLKRGYERNAKYDSLRKQYNLEGSTDIAIHNDTNCACDIIFIIKNMVTYDNGNVVSLSPIDHAKKIVNTEKGFFDRTNDNHKVLGVGNNLPLTKKHFQHYNIVAHINGEYNIVQHNSYNIKIKSLFDKKVFDDQVEEYCRFF